MHSSLKNNVRVRQNVAFDRAFTGCEHCLTPHIFNEEEWEGVRKISMCQFGTVSLVGTSLPAYGLPLIGGCSG
jgi:hypothetical protein